MRRLLVIALALGAAIFVAIYAINRREERDDGKQGISFPLSKTVADPAGALPFDPSLPFRLELGRGSAPDGLETVLIEPNGAATFHRRGNMIWDAVNQRRDQQWETCQLQLDQLALTSIARAIIDHRIGQLESQYHADVHDGTQWLLRLTQNNRTKRVYFNNHFPQSIQDFAQLIDEQVSRSGLSQVIWKQVDSQKNDEYQTALWRDTP